MKTSVFIQLKNNIQELSRVVEELEEFGIRNDVPSKIVTDFALSVDEIITNIVSYGYEDNKEHLLSVHLFIEDDTMSVTFSDDGRPFNPLQVPDADVNRSLEERKVGGLGIYLVKKLMDSVEYRHESGRNIFIIKKKLNQEGNEYGTQSAKNK